MRRGQVTIINMIAILAALVISVVLMPILTNTIDAVTCTNSSACLNATKYSLAIFIMSILPAYLLIIIMIGALQYAQPRIER